MPGRHHVRSTRVCCPLLMLVAGQSVKGASSNSDLETFDASDLVDHLPSWARFLNEEEDCCCFFRLPIPKP